MSKFETQAHRAVSQVPDKKTRTVEQLRARMEPVPIFSESVSAEATSDESLADDANITTEASSDAQIEQTAELVEVSSEVVSESVTEPVVELHEQDKESKEVPLQASVTSSKEEKPFFMKKNRANEAQKGNAPRELQKPEFPYPKNWNLGETNMSEAHLVEVAETRRRNQELPTITLPTSEKSINEDLINISVRADEDKISTVISVPTTNKGTIETREGVLVQGTQIGDIKIDLTDVEDKAGTVVISRSGTVRGDIEGKRVVVFGRVEGSIRSVTHITLAETAVVTGDIYYRKLRMMDGAEIEGNCQKLKEEEI